MAALAAAVAPGSERVLLCGDTKGKFRLLVRLLQQVQQRQGPFGAVICCGSFFGGPPASNSNNSRQCSSGSPSHSSKNASANSSGRDGAITGGENTTVNDTSCTSSSPATRGETAAPTSCSSSTTKATEDRGSLAESAATGAAAAGAAAAAAHLSPSVVEKAVKGGATTDSVSSRSLAPEGGGTAAAADVTAGAADAAAANPAAKGAEAATASLSTVLNDAYPQEFNELQEAAVKLPMPLYFIDEQVSSLVPVGWYGQGEDCGGDGALSSPPGTPSRLSCAAADAANSEVHAGYAVPEATAATAAPPAKSAVSADAAAAAAAGEDQAGGPATRKATAETDTDKQPTGVLSPQQVCSNVFWLGRAGLARVSGLKVALCALSNADEQLLLQHEQQEPQHEQQEQQHEQQQPQQEQQQLQQEQQQAQQEQQQAQQEQQQAQQEQQQAQQEQQQAQEQELQEEEEDLGHEVEEGSLKRRRLIRGTSRVAGSSTAAVPSARPTCAAAAALPAAEATPAAEAAGTGPVLSAPATAPAPAVPSSPCAPTAAAARERAWWHEVVAAAALPEWEGRVDIFVSCRWPADVLQQMQPLPTFLEATASDSSNEAAEKLQALLRKIGVDKAVVERGSSVLAARLAAILEPRYLFAASAGVFYQRLPFRSPLYGYVSRFTSLGIVGAKTPETKPLHALQLQPIDALLAAVPGERFPGALRPLPFHPCSVRGSNASSSNHLSSGDITDGSAASGTSSRLCGCVGKEEAAAGAAEEERAKAETARAALSTLPSNSTASPFIGFLPFATQQELLQQASRRLLPPSTDPSAAGDAIAAGATYRTSSGADTASSLLGPRPSPSVSSSTAGASVPPPPPPSQAGGPRQGQQQRQQQPPRRCCVVCVCNLPYNVDEASLQKVMEAFGEVKFIYAPRDSQDSSKGTGKAFVVFVEPQSAEKAVEASGQLEAGRRVLRVAFWREKIPFAHRQQQQQKQLPKAGTVLVTEAHAECWFCLANPKVEKHLVAAVGDACYVAAPKGGLHPLHALVVPITHFPSVAFAPAEVREEVGRQVEAYRRALKQQENMDCIVYERYVPMRATKAMHTQVQCVPCTTAQGYRAAEFFKKKAKAVGITLQPLDCTQSSLPFSELPQLVTGTERAYFYLDLPGLNTASGHRAERLFYCQPNPGNTTSAAGGNRGGRPDYTPRLPMNFGRDVVATIIDKPEMADWQNCTEDQSQETTRAARLTRLLSE